MVRQRVESIHDVVQGAVGRHVLIHVVIQGLGNKGALDNYNTAFWEISSHPRWLKVIKKKKVS